jgi:hypothetical protein
MAKYTVYEVGYPEYAEVVDASSPREAAELVAADFERAERTYWVRMLVEEAGGGDRWRIVVPVDPEEPDCPGGEHEWCSPIEVVGGMAENPGVWGHGAGVVVREVCRNCGTYRITDTWAQDPDTGEQGLTAVWYEEADEASLAWVRRLRGEEEEEPEGEEDWPPGEGPGGWYGAI